MVKSLGLQTRHPCMASIDVRIARVEDRTSKAIDHAAMGVSELLFIN